jgi:hypothetical protein
MEKGMKKKIADLEATSKYWQTKYEDDDWLSTNLSRKLLKY